MNVCPGTVPNGKERPLNMRLCILQPLLIVALLAACPASAQVYKWVDESGVTNYTSEPPTNNKAVKKFELLLTKEDTSSQAAPAEVRGNQQRLLDRINKLERQVQAERQARQYESELQAQQYAARGALPHPVTYDPCVDWYEGCNGSAYNYGGYYPSPVVVAHHRPRPIVRPVPVNRMPGISRGTANSAMDNRFASAGGPVASRGR